MKRIAPVLVVFGVSLFGLASCGGKASLRRDLERSYARYLDACRSGREEALAKSISSSTLGQWRNTLTSLKEKITPDKIKSHCEDDPQLDDLSFKKVARKGATAGLLYFGAEADDGLGKLVAFRYFVKFVREKGQWRVHAKMWDSLHARSLDLADTYGILQVDGRVPAAPTPYAEPDVCGRVDAYVTSDWHVSVEINGIEQLDTDKSISGAPIRPGLKFGNNRIVAYYRPTPELKPTFDPEVTIRLCDKNGGLETQELVFPIREGPGLTGVYRTTFPVPREAGAEAVTVRRTPIAAYGGP